MKRRAKAAALVAGAALNLALGAAPLEAQTLPNPILYLIGTEHYSTPSGNFVRYRYDVFNKAAYPAELFAAAPDLPPCGNNANSARTWVDFFEDRTNRRLYGFCALAQPANLGSLWFALPEGALPPSWVYIEMVDRRTNRRYRSNLADTVM